MDTNKKEERKLTAGSAAGILLLVIAVVVAGIWTGVGTEISLFFGAFISMMICLILRRPWKKVEDSILKFLSQTLVVMIILIDVGIMVGAWIIGGTVPSLMYYGLKLVTPSLILPIAFFLCAIMSIFTGTSFGSIATMGLALTGVAAGVGVPVPLVAGAVVAGAHVGDKMSPMSDSTNLCSAVTGVKLYDHIGSMMHTTIPAAVISLILYLVIGLRYSSGSGTDAQVKLMLSTLSDNFNISLIALIPAILMLVIAIAKIPAVLGLTSCAVFSIFFAMLMQHTSFIKVVTVAYSGYTSHTGVDTVDAILNRGGMSSMMGTVGLIVIACLMGGALQATGALDVLMEDFLMKKMKTPRALVFVTMLYNYLILFMSGNQMLGAVMAGPTFEGVYDKMNVNRKVLSRAIGDTTIVASGLVPWGVTVVYTMGVLGCDASFIPYEFFCYIVPVFTIIAACTGWATWHTDGTPFKKNEFKMTPTDESPETAEITPAAEVE